MQTSSFTQMKNALLLHGTDATSKDNWFPWLKEELEKKGYAVWVPNLPHPNKPNIKRYTNFLLAHKHFIFNEETVIIGHSSGAVEILGLLQALPKDVVIDKAILVAGFTNDLGWDALKELFEKPFDYEEIKKHAKKFILIHSDNDPYVSLDHGQTLKEQLDAELLIQKDQKHFSLSMDPQYNQFPLLLTLI